MSVRPRVVLAATVLLSVVGCVRNGSAPTETVGGQISPERTQTTSSDPETVVVSATETPESLAFSHPRDSGHRLIFFETTDTEQTALIYDYEANSTTPIYVLPPEISLHRQEEPQVNPALANLYRPLPRGLTSLWMALSPDRTRVAVLQPAVGGLPNYVHEIDLLTGQIYSVLLLDDYEWQIPTVPDRTPILGPPAPQGLGPPENLSDVFSGFNWAPNGTGYTFVIRTPTEDAFELDRFQIYFVESGEGSARPLAGEAPGMSVGKDSVWSPDSRQILYLGEVSNHGIWLIGMDNPDEARLLTENRPQTPFRIIWSPDSASIYFEYRELAPSGVAEHLLVGSSLIDGTSREILRVVPEADEQLALIPVGFLPVSGGLVIRESHSVTEAPDAPDPDFALDPLRSRTFAYLEGTLVELDLLGIDDRPFFSISPTDDWILLRFASGGPCVILSLPEERVVYGPDDRLCQVGTWSPDGHLLLGLTESEEVVILDLDTGEFGPINLPAKSSSLMLLTWIPEPELFDRVVSFPGQ